MEVSHLWQAAWRVLVEHRYALLGGTAFVDQLVLLVPVVPLLVSAGALAGRGELHLTLAVAVLSAGIAPADFVWYLVGRGGGSRVLGRVCRISAEPATCIRRARSFFDRYGAGALVFVKFVPGLSTVALPLSGVAGLPTRRFVMFDAIGALLWTAAYVVAGDVAARHLTRVGPAPFRAHGSIVVIVVAAGALYVAWRRWRAYARQRARRRASATAPLLVQP
jgi:membrane protein DedA with SNARE-associated domain